MFRLCLTSISTVFDLRFGFLGICFDCAWPLLLLYFTFVSTVFEIFLDFARPIFCCDRLMFRLSSNNVKISSTMNRREYIERNIFYERLLKFLSGFFN